MKNKKNKLNVCQSIEELIISSDFIKVIEIVLKLDKSKNAKIILPLFKKLQNTEQRKTLTENEKNIIIDIIDSKLFNKNIVELLSKLEFTIEKGKIEDIVNASELIKKLFTKEKQINVSHIIDYIKINIIGSIDPKNEEKNDLIDTPVVSNSLNNQIIIPNKQEKDFESNNSINNLNIEFRKVWEGASQEELESNEILTIEADPKSLVGTDLLKKATIDHRNISHLSPTASQVWEFAKHQPEKLKKILKNIKKIILGDGDMGAYFTLWFLQQFQKGENIEKYKNLMEFVAKNDAQGRANIFSMYEPQYSLGRLQWGVILAYPNDNETQFKKFSQIFNFIINSNLNPFKDNIDISNIDPKITDTSNKWITDTHNAVNKALEKKDISKHSVILKDFNPLDNSLTKWDEACVQVHNLTGGKYCTLAISGNENDKGELEMQISSFGRYNLYNLGKKLEESGYKPWYANGYVGLYGNRNFIDKFIEISDDYIDNQIKEFEEIDENIVYEFEVIFDDPKYLTEISEELLKNKLITGFNPPDHGFMSEYLWDEYGKDTKDGVHNKINVDQVYSIHTLVSEKNKDKVLNFYTKKIPWAAPLIKIDKKEVNKAFFNYINNNT